MPRLKQQGRRLCVSSRKLVVCGCGGLTGPCCATGQDCTIVDNGSGGWTFGVQTALTGSVVIPSSGFQDGRPGTSPGFTASFNFTTAKTQTLAGLGHCSDLVKHAYQVSEDFFGKGTIDPDGLLSGNTISHTIPYVNPGAFPNNGCQGFGVNVDARIGVASIAAVAHGSALIAGTPQASGVRATLNFTIAQEEYIASNANGNLKGPEAPGFGLAVEIYGDGTFAAWDFYGSSGGTNAITIAPQYNGACLSGAALSFTLGRPTVNPVTTVTCSGSISIGWTAGIGKCKEATDPPPSAQACAYILRDGYGANVPSNPPPSSPLPLVEPTDNPLDMGAFHLP